MTNTYEDDFEDDFDESTDSADSSPRGLRRAANKSKKLENELTQMRRELAFTKAGINPDDPRMRYFVRGYDGELSSEAVRDAAIEAGFLQQQTSSADPTLQNAAAAQSRVMQASGGAMVEDSTEDAAYARLAAAMEEGGVDAMLDVARQYGIPIQSEM